MLTQDLVTLLQSLRQCYRLAIITNGPSNAQWEKVQRLNLTTLFDCILVSADLPWEKPNPNIFYAACKYLGVDPENCVMIGDKIETDIQVGQNCRKTQKSKFIEKKMFEKNVQLWITVGVTSHLFFFIIFVLLLIFNLKKKKTKTKYIALIFCMLFHEPQINFFYRNRKLSLFFVLFC